MCFSWRTVGSLTAQDKQWTQEHLAKQQLLILQHSITIQWCVNFWTSSFMEIPLLFCLGGLYVNIYVKQLIKDSSK